MIRPGLTLVLLGLATLTSCGAPSPLREACEPDSIPDAYARAGAALMWPGMPRAFHVDDRGQLSNGLWRMRFRFASGSERAPRRVAYQDRWLPIVHWACHDGAVRWDFEAVAFPARSELDSVLAVSLVAEATNTSPAAAVAELAATLDTLSSPVFVAVEGETPESVDLRWGSGHGSGLAVARAEAPGGVRWSLRPGERRRTRFVLTSHRVDERDLEDVARPSHAQRQGMVRDYWTRQMDAGTAFELNDPELEAAMRAARVVLLACRERWNGGWIPIGGPFQYRDTWLRDGARLVSALAVTGYTNEAREAALGFAKLQWPHGPFLTQRGQLDGPGQALWLFDQAFLRPPGYAELPAIAAQAARCWRWSESQRDLGRQSGWRFGRMLPFAEPRDNELTRAQLVGNDAWMIAGYAAAARLAGAAGQRSDSIAIEQTRVAYLDDFRAALALTGSDDVPPSWQGVGRDWGNIAACWPARVLDPQDPRCERLAARLWARSGGAMLTYANADSLQSYVGADLGTWALLDGRPAAADSVLRELLFWRNASGAHAEYFSRSARDFGRNLPPHPTPAAALLSLVRNALVYDDGDTLMLTLGARADWWRGASVKRAPTRWGTIDLRFERDGDDATWEWTPMPVWTLLRLPPGARVDGAPAPPLLPGPDPTSVLAPPGTGRARVRVGEGS
ncbi:MAG TPA: hypothetical protein VJY35_07520 [Candidatus Eisenbacteria bacterium]|nr:hypothetical protein [Candidatus Eisenbacteria bacterium]